MNKALQKLASYTLLVTSVCLAATLVNTLAHELIGHLGVAKLFGAEAQSFEVRAFGGGSAQYSFAQGVGDLPWVFASAGGIIVNLLMGVVCLAGASRNKRRPILALALCIVGGAGVLTGLGYIAMGSYYGAGDPETVLLLLDYWPVIRSTTWWIWTPALVLLGIAVALFSRIYFSIQDCWWPRRTWWQRLAIGGSSLGGAMSVLLVGALLSSPAQHYSPKKIVIMERLDALSEHAAEVEAQLRSERPEMDEAERQQLLREISERKTDELLDNERPVPLMPILALLMCAGGLVGSRIKHKAEPVCDASLSWRSPLAAAGVALVLALLCSILTPWSF